MTQLEHANITVPDIDAALRFLGIAAPDFSVRKDGIAEQGYRWLHFGNDKSYIALQAVHVGFQPKARRETVHQLRSQIIWVWLLKMLWIIEAGLIKAGYKQNGPMVVDTYRRRIYFYDDAGFEWELIEYLSESPAEMNLYE